MTKANCPIDAGDAARMTGRVHLRDRAYATCNARHGYAKATMWRGPPVAAISPTDASKFRRGTGVAGG